MSGVPRLSLGRTVLRSEKLLLAAILIICAGLRAWPLRFDYFHPDETIAVSVARHVVDTGALDTNWKNAALPPDFKLPQYNFSGYMLSAAAVEGAARGLLAGDPEKTLWRLRLWSALLSLAVTGLTFVAARRLFDTPTGLVASALVALNPLLVQDAFYARPEPFVTALTLALVIGGPHRAPLFWRTGAAALVAGLLIATKISMLALLPLLALPERAAETAETLTAYLARVARELPVRTGAIIIGVTLGFALAAPYALVNRADYMEGIAFLMRQYNAPQWPYGPGEATTFERLAYVLSYFAATTGAVALGLSVAGAAWAGVGRNFRAVGIFLCCFAFAAWFATYPTFFERNFSHIMPIVLIFAAFGIVRTARLFTAPVARAGIVALVLAAAAYPAARMTSLLLVEEVTGRSWLDLGALRARLTAHYGAPLTILDAREDFKNLEDPNFRLCGKWLVEMPHYHGPRADAALAQLTAATGFTEVGRFTSHFAFVPASSLHTYVMPTRLYLYRGNDAAGCEPPGEIADPRTAGEILPVRIDADAAWTPGGAYPTYFGFAPSAYHGTWSWTGGPPTGALRYVFEVEGLSDILVPYLSGPDTQAQTLRVTDAATGAEILNLAPLPASQGWRYRRVAVPPGTKFIAVEAIDNDPAPTAWFAVAPPHALLRAP